MGHYRQQLIRGRPVNADAGGAPDGHLPPVIDGVDVVGGWAATLTAVPGSNAAWWMTLWSGPDTASLDLVASFGQVVDSPTYLAGPFSNELLFWSQLSSEEFGAGDTGPFSDPYSRA
jgi:hypothetical protein